METTYIKMEGGYLDSKGRIIKRIESKYEFYLIELETGQKIVAGPSSFRYLKESEYERSER